MNRFRRLPNAKLKALRALVSSGDFESERASKLDYAIVDAISKVDPDYDTLAGLTTP